MAGKKGKDSSELFEVVWRPFQLNADASLVGVNKKQMYESRFGAERTAMMMKNLQGVGAAVGINFTLGGNTGNTLQSHRLVDLALETGGVDLQNKVIESIFKSYFEEEGDITDKSNLIKCAVRGGLTESAAEKMLNDPSVAPTPDTVSANIVDYRNRYRVSGVPHFKIGNKTFSGAQESDFITSILEENLR